MTSGSVEYAFARLSARHGARLDEVQWHRIEQQRSLADTLEVIRATPLGGCVEGMTPHSDLHTIERQLREHWRRLVDEVARWMPQSWQAATAWCAMLPDLPLIAHFADGGRAPAWMSADPYYGPLLEPRNERSSIALLAARRSGAAPSAWVAWHAKWRAMLPAVGTGVLPEMERIVRAHLVAFRGQPHGDGTPSRRQLGMKLSTLFRRAIATPAAAFVFLLLALLDFERLRGVLLRRAAFPGPPPSR